MDVAEVDPIRPLPRSVRIVLDRAHDVSRRSSTRTPSRGIACRSLEEQCCPAVFTVQGTLPALDRGRILEELEFRCWHSNPS